MSFKALIIAFFSSSILLCSCSDDDDELIDCAQSNLELSLSGSTNATSCNASDGSVSMNASGGSSPYSFQLGTQSNTTGSFQSLAVGSYDVKVIDANGCERSLQTIINAEGSTLALDVTVQADSECLSDNGVITAAVSGGVSPFQFRIDAGSFGVESVFSGLENGSYTIEVRDSEGCTFVESVTVPRANTGISFASQIKPIIDTKCAIPGCHNGDNGANRNWTVFANVKENAASIKTRTGNRSMPQTGSLTQEQIDIIACWVDDGALNN